MNVPWPLYFAIGSLLTLAILLLGGFRTRADERISEMAGGKPTPPGSPPPPGPRTAAKLDADVRRRLAKEKKQDELRDRLMQAGFYNPRMALLFTIFRVLVLVLPVLIGWGVSNYFGKPLAICLMIGFVTGVAGTLAPSFMLDFRKAARQQKIRRALPDALDVLNVCLEGGMSLPGALSRVSKELAGAHPALALELSIVDRETRMGRGVSESLKGFADRVDLAELRSLASVVGQAERYGASVANALDVYAETMRYKRSQSAEERAQKAVIKVIFPTMFCIFPAMFVVIMGPAAINIYKTLVLKQP
jgi:tight adherence protein C